MIAFSAKKGLSFLEAMGFSHPEHSREEVDCAGQFLIAPVETTSFDDWSKAYEHRNTTVIQRLSTVVLRCRCV
jgi:hypothetical protein